MTCPTPCACQACIQRELARPAMHPDLDGVLMALAERPVGPVHQAVVEREIARLATLPDPTP